MRNKLPALLSISFLAAIVLLALQKFAEPTGVWVGEARILGILMVALYLAWLACEFKVAKHEDQKGQRTFDFGTCELYAAGRALTFLSCLWFDQAGQRASFWLWAGMALFLVGVGIRLTAIHTLGRYYSHIVRKVDAHRIIDTGPYKYVRHPAYTGMILAHMGVVLFFYNPVSLAILAFLLIPAIVLRIHVEEKTLFTIDGYPDFAKSRQRLLPYIW